MAGNGPDKARRKRKLATPWWIWLLVVPLVPVVLLTVLLVAIAYVCSWLAVHLGAWSVWHLRGRRVLLVFSDSPHWRDFMGGEVAARLGTCAVVLNRSQQSRRRFTLACFAYQHFGGWRDHCPLAVVFRPFRRSRIYRFHKPFIEWKHGKPEALRETVTMLFSDLGITAPGLPVPPSLND